MAGRFSTAGVGALAAALWASAAFAASPQHAAAQTPAMKLASRDALVARGVPLVNLDLGSAMPVGTAAIQLQRGTLSPSVALASGRRRSFDLFGALFRGAAGLRSTWLMGTSTTAGANFALGSDLSVGLGHTALSLNDFQPDALTRALSERIGPERRATGTTSATLNWNFKDWADLGLTASQGSGNGALLGAAPGTLAASGALNSAALGISARVGFGEGWVTSLSYSEGVTQLDLSSAGVNAATDALHSEAYGISLAKQGLFGGDALGIAVSRPLEIYSGNSNLVGLNNLQSMSGNQAHESDVELGYVTTFLDGTLALQANAAYQMNAAGAKGQNALTGLARAKINF